MPATTVKTPDDRRPKAAEALENTLNEDEILSGIPELTPPNRLRIRQRNVITKLAVRLSGFVSDDEASISIDTDDPRLPVLLDVLADVDDFAESIAADPAAYREWAAGKDYEVFSALLTRYASAVGESNAS